MDTRTVIDTLRASFERQSAIYRELLDSSRTAMSKLVLSRGDVGVLMAGVDKKARLIERINQERVDVADHIQYWHDNRDRLSGDRAAAELNGVFEQTEAVIKEFLAEEEKLKQYVEKIYKPGRETV